MANDGLPSGWAWRTLGELAKYVNGAAFKPSDWGITGLPIIRIQNLSDPEALFNYFDGSLPDKFRVKNGDLLVSWSATLGVYDWSRGPAWLNQHIFRVDVNDMLVEKQFLALAIKHGLVELKRCAHGLTMQHVKRGPFEATRVAVPPLTEQRRIVARIEELTAQLDQARRLHREAQDEFSRIILAAIHRFARDIAHEFRTLGEYLADRPRNGWSPIADAAEGSGAPVLTLSAVTGFHYDGTRVKWTSLPTRPDAHYWLAPGDLLITRSNTPELVGHAAIYDGTPAPCICSDLIMKMRVNPAKADVRFVHYWLQTGVVRNHITSRARGTSGTMKKIAQNDVQEIPVPNVPLAEQRRIVAHLDGMSAHARTLQHVQAEIAAELDSFTPALLAKAFRGEL